MSSKAVVLPSAISYGDLVGRALGATAVLGSLTLPWVRSRSVGTQNDLRVIELPVFRWIYLGLLAILTCSTIWQLSTKRIGFLRGVESAIAAAFVLVPLFAVAVLEILSIWLYPSFLPSTIRRLIIGVTPQSGMWLAIIGGGVVVLSVLEITNQTFELACNEIRRLAHRDVTALTAPLLLFGLPLAMDARDQSWLNFSSKIGRWSLPGFAIPFLGILTLILFAIALVAGISAFISSTETIGIVLVVSGWLLTLPSSILYALSSRRFHITLPSIIRTHLRQWSTTLDGVTRGSLRIPPLPNHLEATLQPGRGLLLCYISGAMIAFAGLLTCQRAIKVPR